MHNEAGFIISDPWATNSMPVRSGDSAEIVGDLFPKLHRNGTLFRYVCIPLYAQTKQFSLKIQGSRTH